MLNDPRRFGRLTAAGALIAGPIVTLAGMATTPWEPEPTTASYHDALAGSPGQAQLAAVLLCFGYLLLLGAALGLVQLTRRASPRLAHVGAVLAVLGLGTLPGLLVTDFYDLAMARALPRSQSVAIADAAQAGAGAAIIGLVAVAGTALGLLVLTIAAYRAGVARVWAPFAVIVGWALPAVSGTGLVPAVAGASLLLLVFGSIGVRVARMSDAAWAERPAGRASRTRRREAAVTA